jgi:hypothetical protein
MVTIGGTTLTTLCATYLRWRLPVTTLYTFIAAFSLPCALPFLATLQTSPMSQCR